MSLPLRLGNTALFEEMLQRGLAFGNTESDLTGQRFEPETFFSTDECVTTGPTGRCDLLRFYLLRFS